jgi:hypothetical protein
VRLVFAAYLVVIATGLAVYIAVGLPPMRFLRDNSLSLFFGTLFLAAAAGRSVVGHSAYNRDQLAHEGEPVSYGRYLLSSDFGQALLENWQSEFLAVGTMAVFTIYLRQRGSPASKPVGAAHDETGASG